MHKAVFLWGFFYGLDKEFFSESTDAYVISSDTWTLYSPVLENLNLLRNWVVLFDSLEACKGKKAMVGWLAQP